MLHFSCDLCGRPSLQDRYSVTVELKAEFDPTALTDADLDADHLSELAHSLECGDAAFGAGPLPRQSFRFDLCPACAERYRRDPLSRERMHRVDFSAN